MEQRLFILLFLTGFAPLILSVSRKYYLIKQGKTWSDAQAYCRATYTDLAIIQSNEDMVKLQNEVQRQQFSSSAWIGLYNDINNWHWSMGNEPLGSMRIWYDGQPNIENGEPHCVLTNRMGWQTKICSASYCYVCFDDTRSGHQKYMYMSDSKTWYEAQSYCRQYHTDLASARDPPEYSIIAGMVPGLCWFGLFQDSWEWVDESKFFTVSWMNLTADNTLGNETCGYLSNNQAADAQCSDILAFICYLDPVIKKQQTIKVKVQSDEDVNDPAIKAAILEQIKKKLKDLGMAQNITMKWREQPDGKVFYKKN